MRKNKKSQIHMSESIAAIFIIMILLALGIVFYAAMSKGTMQKTAREDFEKRARSISETITAMPEFVCSIDGGIKSSCLDRHKLKAFAELQEDPSFRDYYYELLGFSTIEVQVIYPDDSIDKITVYDRPIGDFKTMSKFQIPIAVLEDLQRGNEIYSFAILYVSVFQQ